MCNVKLQIAQQWKVKDLDEPAKIIGIEIKHTCDTVSISQKKYIETILKKKGMECANPVATPLDANVTIEPNPDHFEGSATTTYARLLGKIQYIANATQPNISFAAHRLVSFTRNPSMQHMECSKEYYDIWQAQVTMQLIIVDLICLLLHS
jgi:hypothetical protein